MRDTTTRYSFLLVLWIAVLLSGCGPGLRTEYTRAAARLSDAEIRLVAELLRLEDRREFDDDALGSAAAEAHPELRRRTALTLGRLRDVRGQALLVHLLADPDTAVRATAAFSIGQLGDTAAVPHLATLLEGDIPVTYPTVAAEAASALGKLRSTQASVALNETLRLFEVPRGRWAVAEQVLMGIWRFPRDDELTPILRWTEAVDPEIRWRAVYALVRRPDPAATPRLLQLATDPSEQVRSLAVRGLTAPMVDSAGLQASPVLQVLLAATRDTDYATSINATRTLGTFSDPGGISRLTELLDREPAIGVAAAESLGRLGPAAAAAAPALRRAAIDDQRVIGLRAAALLALVTVAPADAEAAAAHLINEPGWRQRANAGRAFGALSPQPREALLTLIRDPDPRVGAATLQAAVDGAGDSLLVLREVLLESLGAVDVQVRTAALTGLERLRDPATLPPLLDAFERAQRDPHNNAALAALDALGALHEAGVPADAALVRRFERPDDALVRMRAIGRFGETARRAWGEPLPIETRRGIADYEALVRRWLFPVAGGAALPRVRIVTESGSIELELFAPDAPLTVESFVSLAEQGYFDGQDWPRVVPNFVIQGGDPRGDQTGGPGYAIRDELNRHRYLRGTLGMALSGPDTGGSQFFITHSPQPHLDGGYTVFGQVVSGMDVVDRVRAGERIESIRRIN